MANEVTFITTKATTQITTSKSPMPIPKRTGHLLPAGVHRAEPGNRGAEPATTRTRPEAIRGAQAAKSPAASGW
jgi:hypothetical protein